TLPRRRLRLRQLLRDRMHLDEGPRSDLEDRGRNVAVEVLMVEPVAVGLQTVDAGRLTGSRALHEQLNRRSTHFLPALRQMPEESRATGHRIVEKHIAGVLTDMPERKQLKILDLHVEDARRAHAQRLDDTEPHCPVLDSVQAQD